MDKVGTMTFRHPPRPQPIRPGGTGVKIPISGPLHTAITRRGERGMALLEGMVVLACMIVLLAIAYGMILDINDQYPEKADPPPVKSSHFREFEIKGHTYIQIDYSIEWLHAASCHCMAKSTVKWSTNYFVGEANDYREEP